jgi:hypothetical protein
MLNAANCTTGASNMPESKGHCAFTKSHQVHFYTNYGIIYEKLNSNISDFLKRLDIAMKRKDEK